MAAPLRSILTPLAAGALLAGCAAGARTGRPAAITGSILVTVEDADAPATVFLDGSLDGREEFAGDTLTAVRLPLPEAAPGEPAVSEYAQTLAPNAMPGSPNSLAVAPDGSWAVVAAQLDGALDIHETLDDLAPLSRLTLLDLRAWPPRMTDATGACREPVSVDAHPNGRRICAVSAVDAELLIANVRGGRFRELVRIPVRETLGVEHAPMSAHWSPDGRTIAVTLGAGGVAFLEVDVSSLDRPVVRPLGEPIAAGAFVRTGAWTPSGDAFLALDVGWIDANRGWMALENTGGVHLIEPGAGIVASAPIDDNPHALAVSPDGTRAVVTGLAKADPAETDQTLRRGGRLTLLRIGPRSIDIAGETRCGSLPMDVAFDAEGARALAADFSTGRVEVFEVRRSRLVFTGVRIETNYGVHQVRVTP